MHRVQIAMILIMFLFGIYIIHDVPILVCLNILHMVCSAGIALHKLCIVCGCVFCMCSFVFVFFYFVV